MKEGDIIAGKYILERHLGSGGMGKVYLASHRYLKKRFAIKFLNPSLLDNDLIRRKFIEEAQIGAQFKHPNIVEVFDIDFKEGNCFIVMEYIDGKNLLQLMEIEEFREEMICQISFQVLDALGYAHDKGIIHRDLKPSNIILTDEGRTYLTDFGIAKALDKAGLSQKMSQTLLTPEFAAPEQASRERFGEHSVRTDIYSFGVTLYCLASGRPPFRGDTGEVLVKHMTEEPPSIMKLNPSLSVNFCRVVERAMRKRQEERFQSAEEMSKALEGGKVEEFVEVPDIVEMTMDKAVSILDKEGFKYKIEYRDVRDSRDASKVLSQKPSPDSKATYGSSVIVVVGRYRELLAPNLTGKHINDAEVISKELNLNIKVRGNESHKSAPVDIVIWQSITPGTPIKQGSVIEIILSKGKGMTVPNIVGIDRERAVRILKEKGFSVKVGVEDVNDVNKDGLIISQSPQPYSEPPVGGEVSVTVGRYIKIPKKIPVPKIIGADREGAIRMLREKGFAVKVYVQDVRDIRKDNIVISQEPTSGREVSIGDEVSITIGSYKPRRSLVKILIPIFSIAIISVLLLYYLTKEKTIYIPDVTKLKKDEATNKIEQKGIKYKIEEEGETNERDIGMVIKQLPVEGKYRESEFNSDFSGQIKLTVGVRSGVKMPSLIGKSKEEAIEILESNNLSLYNITTKETTKENVNKVIEQSPSAGVKVDSGSDVYLVVGAKSKEYDVKICPICGTYNRPDANVCSNCGEDIRNISVTKVRR